jgi:hypothetical protein
MYLLNISMPTKHGALSGALNVRLDCVNISILMIMIMIIISNILEGKVGRYTHIFAVLVFSSVIKSKIIGFENGFPYCPSFSLFKIGGKENEKNTLVT